MSGKFIVNAIAVVGWLIAALVAYAIVALVGFFGVGLIGLLIVFAATQFELDPDRPVPRSSNSGFLRVQPVKFFKYLGGVLALIGFSGFVYYQI
jgi:putative exporter of polyketide antibiotics